MRIADRDLSIAKRAKNDLKKELGKQLVSVIFYGSRARGKARSDSDMDLLLLMNNRPDENSRINYKINEIIYQYLDKNNIYISAIPYSFRDYKKHKKYSPVLYWADKEGIKL